jgi:hypothetical protein
MVAALWAGPLARLSTHIALPEVAAHFAYRPTLDDIVAYHF